MKAGITPNITAQQAIQESERTLQLMIAQAPVAIAIFRGPKYIVEVVNPRALELWGRKAEDVMNRPILEAMPELVAQGVPALLDEVYTTGKPFSATELPVQIVRKGITETAYVNFVYEAIYGTDGNINGLMTVGTNVTEQVNARNKVAMAEERTRIAVDAAMLGTFDLNIATNELVCSHRFSDIFGLPNGNITYQDVVKSFHPDDLQIRDKANQQAALTGLLNYEIRIIWPDKSLHHINVRGNLLFDEVKKPNRLIGAVMDITLQKRVIETIQASEKKFRDTLKQAPVGITIFRGKDFAVDMANETYLEVVDRKEENFVGRPLFDALPEVKTAVEPLLTRVFTTGEPYYGYEFPVNLNRHGTIELTYFNFVYQALREENGTISGIIVIATEVTGSVNAKHALAESERQFKNLVMQSPVPMAILRGKEHVVELANNAILTKIWRTKESEVLGRKILDIFPELIGQKFPQLLNQVYQSGIHFREAEAMAYVDGDGGMKKFYLDLEYAPLFDPEGKVSGLMVTANDVTEQVKARHKAEDARQRLELTTEASGIGTWDLDLLKREIIHSARFAQIFGHDKNKQLTHKEMRDQVHPDDVHRIVEVAFEKAMQTGAYYYEARVVKPDNSIAWMVVRGKVFYDEANKPVKMIGTARDITEEKNYQQELLEREEKFRLLADSMAQQIWTSDIEGNLNYYNQSVYDYSGLTPEQINAGGWLQIVHPDDRDENIRLWTKAVTTGEDFLFEHRFRRHDGEYRWQLSRAIPQRNADGNIQRWVGTSTDIHDQKAFAQELENKVQERTREIEQKNAELKKMNTELQSFAYISSHDLQEPLRKIQIFSNRLMEKENANLSEIGKDYFRRMQDAANRMQTLINDLLAYSRADTTERVFIKTDLNALVDEVKNDLRETLTERQGVIEVAHLNEVNIVPFQFKQLMHNLIGNAIKFSRHGVAPHIQIKSEIKTGAELNAQGLAAGKMYCHISVSDNGIGFEAKYKERIFEVFQRLHGKDEYKGTGIGLAIVKKIVDNHSGIITANGEVDNGATFDIYIPA